LNGRDRGRHRPPRRERRGQTNAKGDSWNPKQASRSPAPVKYDKNGIPYERPRWIAPKLNTDPMPVPICARCGKPITDLYAALTDVHAGGAVHFDCVMVELAKREILEEGDTLSYVGGGRFGIVHFANSGEKRGQKAFTIKKVFEWEDKEKRAEWRDVIADHYSIT